ncbi:MAG: CCA tRNA nucleotidyltransferase, partial [Euryarchaeota archaeon]|nr:CCA tRNA nucleotidyltransferase [Euryarchaeota archaeon]
MAMRSEILKRITPDRTHRARVNRVVSDLIRTVREEVARRGMDLEVRLVGSVAKDTYLRNPDVDLFIMFPTSVPREELESIGLDIGRKVLGGEERYAEHPYVHGRCDGLEVDLVPCYKVDSPMELKSAVDRTPFHTELMKSRLSKRQRLEVRLLKQFMKGVGVYGAEARTQGFSGYLAELLVLRYSDFRSVLESASEWRCGETLWLEERGEVVFDTPLVFYDPVDPKRNVSSALSLDSLALFIQACKEFLMKEDERFFFPKRKKKWDVERIRKEFGRRGTSVVVVSFLRPRIVDDDLYPQIRKTQEGLAALLEKNDFVIVDASYSVGGEVQIAFELQADKLPAGRRHRGPPVWIDHSEKFLERWVGRGLSEPY